MSKGMGRGLDGLDGFWLMRMEVVSSEFRVARGTGVVVEL